jgi:hypothetical protein
MLMMSYEPAYVGRQVINDEFRNVLIVKYLRK